MIGPEAREAMTRYAWGEAFQRFAAADAIAPLGPDELDQMAECAWWIGKMRHCMALRERAYAAYRKEDQPGPAAHVAIDLSQHYGDLGEHGGEEQSRQQVGHGDRFQVEQSDGDTDQHESAGGREGEQVGVRKHVTQGGAHARQRALDDGHGQRRRHHADAERRGERQ